MPSPSSGGDRQRSAVTQRFMPSETPTCDAEAGRYDCMFGVYCLLPEGHEGPHRDSEVEWRHLTAAERAATEEDR